MALYVVFESYLMLVSDYPQAYHDQAGFEFIQQVPTTWDETKILAGQVGDYIATARRKGQDWYIGVMNDWTPRSIQLKFDFLPAGNYEVVVYKDAPDTDQNPNHLLKTVQNLSRKDVLDVQLASGGGQVLVLRKLER
jgi:alpha-glucosidase